MCYLQSNYNFNYSTGLFATIANIDQDSITSMDSCKIGEALIDKCHQSYSKYKTIRESMIGQMKIGTAVFVI